MLTSAGLSGDSARLLSVLNQIPQSACVLEIGCGDCSGVPLASIAGALYIGIDVDLDALRRTARQQQMIWLIQADITHLPLRAQFNLILVRHPDVDRHRAAWKQVFIGIAPFLANSGILIVTAYSAAEIETTRQWLAATGLNRLPLDTARLVEPDLIGRDRFVIAFQRSEPR